MDWQNLKPSWIGMKFTLVKNGFWLFVTILPLCYYSAFNLGLNVIFIAFKKLWKYYVPDFNTYRSPENIISNIFWFLVIISFNMLTHEDYIGRLFGISSSS